MVFSKQLAQRTCAELTHPWNQNCFRAYATMFRYGCIGFSQMFFPIVLAQYIFKARKSKVDKKCARAFLIDYLQYVGLGGFTATLFVIFSCTLRNLLGKFTQSTVAFFPGALSALSLLLVTPESRNFLSAALCNTSLESGIITMQELGLFPKGLTSETLFFMTTNAFLMYFSLLSKSLNNKWFFQPTKDNEPDNGDNSSDNLQFLNSTLKKARQYFTFGVGIGVFRTIIGNVTVLAPKNFIKLFNIDLLKSGVFAASNVVIYESVVHFLRRKFQKRSTKYALPAGFLAGLPYAVDPNLSISLSAFINVIQLAYDLIDDLNIIKRIPMSMVTVCLLTGLLYHIRLFREKDCSRFGKKMINFATNGLDEVIIKAFVKHGLFSIN
ncbi:transmembrane protein 135-like [Adelges cooleyi]|uniref:transmembrane protein 135-like n=1 Tax=Adelges cooleyi TaxID=133065 RepID=UPI0021806938|nr:transmembrane protein 135-like [Adelges cooleyi]